MVIYFNVIYKIYFITSGIFIHMKLSASWSQTSNKKCWFLIDGAKSTEVIGTVLSIIEKTLNNLTWPSRFYYRKFFMHTFKNDMILISNALSIFNEWKRLKVNVLVSESIMLTTLSYLVRHDPKYVNSRKLRHYCCDLEQSKQVTVGGAYKCTSFPHIV